MKNPQCPSSLLSFVPYCLRQDIDRITNKKGWPIKWSQPLPPPSLVRAAFQRQWSSSHFLLLFSFLFPFQFVSLCAIFLPFSSLFVYRLFEERENVARNNNENDGYAKMNTFLPTSSMVFFPSVMVIMQINRKLYSEQRQQCDPGDWCFVSKRSDSIFKRKTFALCGLYKHI